MAWGRARRDCVCRGRWLGVGLGGTVCDGVGD